MTVTYVLLALLTFSFFFPFRTVDALCNFLMVWYYCTLTIREAILRINGSRYFLDFNYTVDSWYKGQKFWFPGGSCTDSRLYIEFRIKGWWVLHHYIACVLCAITLTWKDGPCYREFRPWFIILSMYIGVLQIMQSYYQTACLRRLYALGMFLLFYFI